MCRGHKFFFGTIPLFFSPIWAVFFQGGSLSEICGQNLRNVGQNSCCNDNNDNIKTTALLPNIFEILTTYFRKAYISTLNDYDCWT